MKKQENDPQLISALLEIPNTVQGEMAYYKLSFRQSLLPAIF